MVLLCSARVNTSSSWLVLAEARCCWSNPAQTEIRGRHREDVVGLEDLGIDYRSVERTTAGCFVLADCFYSLHPLHQHGQPAGWCNTEQAFLFASNEVVFCNIWGLPPSRKVAVSSTEQTPEKHSLHFGPVILTAVKQEPDWSLLWSSSPSCSLWSAHIIAGTGLPPSLCLHSLVAAIMLHVMSELSPIGNFKKNLCCLGT